MDGNNVNKSATHLGRTMKRDREAHHWTLRAFADMIDFNYASLSRIENGHRPMTAKLAKKCDKAFPERRGWYLQYYEESKEWVPPGFRDWREYEEKATVLQSWSPGFIDGMLQAPDYAHAQLASVRGATEEVVKARLASRLQRQQRVLFGPEPPLASFVLDELALYRCVGSPEIMAAQCRHLLTVAELAHVTIQMLPAKQHPAGASNLVVADNAVYAEHLLSSGVYTDAEAVSAARLLMTTITSESYPASVTRARIEHMERTWTGVSRRSAAHKAAPASK